MPELIQCPECEKKLKIPDEYLGKKVKCPNCGKQFTAEGEEPEVLEAVEEEAPPVKKAKRARPIEDEEPPRTRRQAVEEQDEDEEEEEEDRPRKKRRRRSTRAVAEDAVAAPAIAMMILGGLGILLALYGTIMQLAGRNFFGAQVFEEREKPFYYWPAYIAGLTLPYVWGTAVLLGGFKLKSLQSWGSVLTAVIFAMLPCNMGCFLGIPVSIWTIIVMNKPEVKSAFE